MGEKFWSFCQRFGTYTILVAVFLFFTTTQGVFLLPANFMNVLRQVAICGIMVTSVFFVMISGGADLSVGGQVACDGLLMAAMMVYAKVPVPVAILLGMLTDILPGCINGATAVALKVTPFVITLCTMLILNGLALVVTNDYPIYDMPASFLWSGQGRVGQISVSVIILILVCITGQFLFSKTYLGREVYALEGNQETTRLADINIIRVQVIIYELCEFFTSIGTIVMLARTNSATATAGSNCQFDCMTAACLGGITFGGDNGSVISSFIDVLIIGILANELILMGVNSNVQQVMKGALLLSTISAGAIQKRHTGGT